MDPALKTRLDTLKKYLSDLPDILPLPEPGLATYNFGSFDISAEEIEDYGEVGAVNRQLEIPIGTHRLLHRPAPCLKNSQAPSLSPVNVPTA
ncbi:hypothetical protein JVU11DRAFT_3899 [Chiua virens]|nr:hypothetical protein JVU11DRAFT_3899 [Chiua virens]